MDDEWGGYNIIVSIGTVLLALLMILAIVDRAKAVNRWRTIEPNVIAHYRFEYSSNKFLDSAGKNDWDDADGTNSTSSTGEYEGERRLADFYWVDNDRFTLYDPNKSADYPLNGTTVDFTIMIRLHATSKSTGTWDNGIFRIWDSDDNDRGLLLELDCEVATDDVFSLELGYGDGSAGDTYAHDHAIGTTDWFTIFVAVHDSNTVPWLRMRVYDSSSYGTAGSVVGTDIDEALSHNVRASDANAVLGAGWAGGFDEIVMLDYAVSFDEMDEMEAGTFAEDTAVTWWCDPVNGDPNSYGTETSPWPALGDLSDDDYINSPSRHPSMRAGDTVYLLEGDSHGRLDFTGGVTTEKLYSEFCTITQAPGHEDANMSGWSLDSGSYWKVKGNDDANKLLISPYPTGGAEDQNDAEEEPVGVFWGHVVGSVGGDANHIWLEDVLIRGTTPAEYAEWDANDWPCKTLSGICKYYGTDLTLRDVTIEATTSGLYDVSLTDGEVNNVLIDHFVSDGMYVAGDNMVMLDTIVQNSHNFNGDLFAAPWHSDIFQLGADSDCENIFIDRCKFITTTDESRSDWRVVQGMFLKGEPLSGTIQNVLLIASHTSNNAGIKFGNPEGDPYYGQDIENLDLLNITILPVPNTELSGWDENEMGINFDGTHTAADCYIENCIMATWPTSGGWHASNNVDFEAYDINDLCVDYTAYDYNIVNHEDLVGKANDVNAPSYDIRNVSRDASPDIGAYEYVSGGDPAGDAIRSILSGLGLGVLD